MSTLGTTSSARHRGLGLAAVIAVLGCGREPAPKPTTRAQPESPSEPSAADTPTAPIPTLAPVLPEHARTCPDGASLMGRLSGAEPAALERMVAEGAPSLSLQARWERDRRFVAEEEGLERLAPDVAKTFAEAVRERSGHAPPGWWVDTLASARRYVETGATGYDLGPQADGDRRGPLVRGDPFVTREGVTAKREGDRVTLEQGTRAVTIDAVHLLEPTLPASTIELAFTPTLALAVPYDPGTGGFPFELRAFELGTGTPGWRALVCSAGRTMLGGLGYLIVELVVEGDAVWVYSAESHGVAIDAFALETGEPRLRFSADLWFARQQPRAESSAPSAP